MKFYLEKITMKSNTMHNGMAWDYPMFIMFTDEDMIRIKRNYIDAQIHGFSTMDRKICVTLKCQEGFTYRDLLEEMAKIKEVTEEQFNWVIDIPHWNPIEKMDESLQAYCISVKKIKEDNEGIMKDDPKTKEKLEELLNGIEKKQLKSKLPYDRRV
jgi:hypothetical protein